MQKLLARVVVSLALMTGAAAKEPASAPLQGLGVEADALLRALDVKETHERSAADLLNEAQKVVTEHFYNPGGLKPFLETLKAGRERTQTLSDAGSTISQALRALQVSHTARYAPDQIEYYELLDLFQTRGFKNTLAMHDGHIAYEGVGMAVRSIEGRLFVTHLYDGGPAQKAGLRVGDEIVAVDGKAYHPIESFKGRAGIDVTIRIRRHPDTEATDLEAPVMWMRPNAALSNAIRSSVRVIEADGMRIGTIRLWTYGAENMRGLLTELLSSEPLRSADGLVLDLRSRWGGYGSEAADLFLSRTRDMTIIGADGKEKVLVARWHKPLVAIIDQGTRSSMEIIAYSLQQAGISLIGMRTAGAVLTVRSFLLRDSSLVLVAVNDVKLDGKRLEGVGVSPDIAVPFDLRFADGADPQFDRAVRELQRRLVN